MRDRDPSYPDDCPYSPKNQFIDNSRGEIFMGLILSALIESIRVFAKSEDASNILIENILAYFVIITLSILLINAIIYAVRVYHIKERDLEKKTSNFFGIGGFKEDEKREGKIKKNIVIVRKKDYESGSLGRVSVAHNNLKKYEMKKIGEYYFHIFRMIKKGVLIFAQNIGASYQIRWGNSIYLYGRICFSTDVIVCVNDDDGYPHSFSSLEENINNFHKWTEEFGVDLNEEEFGITNKSQCILISPQLRYNILDTAHKLEESINSEEKKLLISKILRYSLSKDYAFLEGRFGRSEDIQIREMMNKLRKKSNKSIFNKEEGIYL